MCTITYLPLQDSGGLITQNRDESPLRPAAIFPSKELRQGKELLFPQDPQAGGSWIATDQQQRLVCLMNGAFEQHTPEPPYRLSRGQVLLDAAAAESPKKFIETYELQEIEAFTLLFFQLDSALPILELKWDGKSKHSREYAPDQAHIWSAPQLYSQEEQEVRKGWFASWLQSSPSFTSENILNFHLSAGNETADHSLLFYHELARTLSITQAIMSRKEGIRLSYIPAGKFGFKANLKYKETK